MQQTTMQTKGSIEQSIELCHRIQEFLSAEEKFDDANQLNLELRKSLVISAFSYVEHCFIEMLKQWLQNASKTTSLTKLVETKVFDRGFYKLFEFKEPHQRGFNRFLKSIDIEMESLTSIDRYSESYAKSFIRLGYKRNELVHKNYVEQNLGQLTVEDISQMYQHSMALIEAVNQHLQGQLSYNGTS